MRWVLRGMEAQRRIENLFLISQAAISRAAVLKRGRRSTVDFLLNGRLNTTALEVVRNGTTSSLEQHFHRFDVDTRWPNCAVLNLQMTGKGLAHSRADDKRLFTFVREDNALYWGSKLHKPNVMLRLRSPISRFHTFVRAWR